MAIISPYADPSAHGKVTPGLMFKRRGPRVIFGAAPRPKDKNTAAQQLQRDKIRQAVANYKLLNYEEKIFLRRRGSMLGKNPYQLYTSSQLKGNDWNKVQGHQLQIINDMVIFDREQDDPTDMRFNLLSTNTKAIRDNTILYTNLNSETAGEVPSTVGPNFDWSGTPDHAPLKYDDGAFSDANGISLISNDSGQFFKDTMENYMLSFWVKMNVNIVNGQPPTQPAKMIYEWRGSVSPSNNNLVQMGFTKTFGLFIAFFINGSVFIFNTTDSNITFNAGEVRYVSLAYVRSGIDGGSTTLKMYFGTDEDLYEVGSFDTTLSAMTASSTQFTLMSNTSDSSSLEGGLDNVKITTVKKQSEIDEINNTRTVETFEADLGYVFDNENIFYPGQSVLTVPEFQLTIESLAPLDWAVPFYWALAITWSNESITERTTIIRLPKIVVDSSEAIILYLSTDMSNYFDEGLYRLGATDNV